MTPAAPEPADLSQRLRQQLILAQVRIMELEDARDTLAPKIAELEALLRSTQQLADAKLDEAAHAARVLADTQAHAAALQSQLAHAAQQLVETTAALDARASDLTHLESEISTLRQALDAARAAQRATATELAAVTASRTWRWTAWLRRLAGKS